MIFSRWWQSIKKQPFLSFSILFFLAYFIALNINNRTEFHDFMVYFTAAQQFVLDQQVYGIPFGIPSGIYKYAPFTLYFFIPFLLFPVFIAKMLYYIIGSAGIITAIFFSYRLIGQNVSRTESHTSRDLILFFTFLVIVVHFYRELELGNVNLLLLLILLFALKFILNGKSAIAGILIAVTILIKPHFIVLIPLLLLRRQWISVASLFLMLIVGLLSPALIAGWQGNIDLHSSWISTMMNHNDGIRLFENPNTIQHYFYTYALRFVLNEVAYWYNYLIVLLVAVPIFWFILTNNRFMVAHPENKEELYQINFSFEYILLIALVPSITYTDTEHFLFSLPVILLLIAFLRQKDFSIPWLTTVSVVALVFYGMNWHDLWGHRLSVWFNDAGLLGIGNLLLIFCTLYWFFIWRRQLVLSDTKQPLP